MCSLKIIILEQQSRLLQTAYLYLKAEEKGGREVRYKCAFCGCIFDEEDAGRRTEHEEFWGAPCSITYNTCPECGEDISDEDEYEEEEEEEE